MTINQCQILRSTTLGNRPSGRSDGEPYVNFAEKQFGVVSGSTPIDLIGVPFFSTTATYSAGNAVNQGGSLYVALGAVAAGAFNPSQWSQVTGGGGGGASVSTGTSPPASPADGALWFDMNSGQLFIYYNDGTSKQWVVVTNQNLGGYLLTSGGVITGALTVNGATTIKSGTIDNTVIGATTPAAASVTSLNGGQLAGMRNLLINGDFRIDQRYNGALLSGIGAGSAVYIPDRWFVSGSQGGKLAVQRMTSTTPGSAYCFQAATYAAYTVVAADYFAIAQTIEGLNIAHLNWGTANAKPVTLSGIITASIAGSYALSLRNGAANRSYVALVNVPTAGVDTPFAITVPGDTAGTWTTDTTAGMIVTFDLGSGTTYNAAAANAWAAGNFFRTAATVNMLATLNASFRIKDIQVEQGSVATPFERRLYGAELTLCQRYFQRLGGPPGSGGASCVFQGYAAAASTFSISIGLPAAMRIVPTVAISGSWTQANVGTVIYYPSQQEVSVQLQPAVGAFSFYGSGGYLAVNAEL